MSKIIVLTLGTLLIGLWLSSCSNEDVNPDDGFTEVVDAKPITAIEDIIGNWVVESATFGNVLTDSLYTGLNVTFSDRGQVFLNGGAYSTNGSWRLQDGKVSINGLNPYKGESNGLNLSASESNNTDGWDTNKISSQKIELFNNGARKKVQLKRL
ncbi:hypothetical protein R9C00_29420 [Flammeovirgaceae bacterium SG7u.111]|nr:hypothetical protein [Flammeovirgaceae bacterium SG7u.132]WPO35820.1 hypothetical protein R9C00_29420 [Flammeovirgaceae bacterium SG7u.111]